VLSRLVSQIEHSLPGNFAVDTIVFDWNGTLDYQQVLPLILLHGFFLDIFNLMAGTSIQRLMIVQGYQVQQKVLKAWLFRAQQGFRRTGALLAMEPDDRRAFFWIGYRLGHCHSSG